MQKPIAYMGIDPGQTGAAVIISEAGIDVVDWSDPVKFSADLRMWGDDYDIRLAIVEAVHSMPKQGVSSTFKFGCNFGMIQGILAALQIPYRLLTPQAWRKGLVMPSDGDGKMGGLVVARRMFPQCGWLSRKKDHNRADALLMASVARKYDF